MPKGESSSAPVGPIVCRKCGKVNPPERSHCLRCGSPLPMPSGSWEVRNAKSAKNPLRRAPSGPDEGAVPEVEVVARATEDGRLVQVDEAPAQRASTSRTSGGACPSCGARGSGQESVEHRTACQLTREIEPTSTIDLVNLPRRTLLIFTAVAFAAVLLAAVHLGSRPSSVPPERSAPADARKDDTPSSRVQPRARDGRPGLDRHSLRHQTRRTGGSVHAGQSHAGTDDADAGVGMDADPEPAARPSREALRQLEREDLRVGRRRGLQPSRILERGRRGVRSADGDGSDEDPDGGLAGTREGEESSEVERAPRQRPRRGISPQEDESREDLTADEVELDSPPSFREEPLPSAPGLAAGDDNYDDLDYGEEEFDLQDEERDDDPMADGENGDLDWGDDEGLEEEGDKVDQEDDLLPY